MKANNEKAQSAQVNNVNNNNVNNVTDNVQATATNAVATDEKEAQEKEAQRKKAIAAKVAEIKKTTKEIHEKRDVTDFLDTSDKGIAASTATKFQTLGKFLGKFQAIEAKDGGKTVYIFESEKDIYIGFTSSELSDIFKLEKRQYKKNGESDNKAQSDNSTIIALRALKESIEKLNKIEKYKTMFAAVKVEDVEKAIESEREQAKEISDFIAQRGTDIEDSTTYTEESKLLEEYGTKFVAKLKTYKLGFFAPKESTEESTEESNQQTEQTEESK